MLGKNQSKSDYDPRKDWEPLSEVFLSYGCYINEKFFKKLNETINHSCFASCFFKLGPVGVTCRRTDPNTITISVSSKSHLGESTHFAQLDHDSLFNLLHWLREQGEPEAVAARDARRQQEHEHLIDGAEYAGRNSSPESPGYTFYKGFKQGKDFVESLLDLSEVLKTSYDDLVKTTLPNWDPADLKSAVDGAINWIEEFRGEPLRVVTGAEAYKESYEKSKQGVSAAASGDIVKNNKK